MNSTPASSDAEGPCAAIATPFFVVLLVTGILHMALAVPAFRKLGRGEHVPLAQSNVQADQDTHAGDDPDNDSTVTSEDGLSHEHSISNV